MTQRGRSDSHEAKIGRLWIRFHQADPHIARGELEIEKDPDGPVWLTEDETLELAQTLDDWLDR